MSQKQLGNYNLKSVNQNKTIYDFEDLLEWTSEEHTITAHLNMLYSGSNGFAKAKGKADPSE